MDEDNDILANSEIVIDDIDTFIKNYAYIRRQLIEYIIDGLELEDDEDYLLPNDIESIPNDIVEYNNIAYEEYVDDINVDKNVSISWNALHLLDSYYNKTSRNAIAFFGLSNTSIDIPSNLTITELGISMEMFEKIVQLETSKKFGYSMSKADLEGIDLGDANGHKTFGYGLLYYPGGDYMDKYKSSYTQSELENLYKLSVKNMYDKVVAWQSKNNLTLTQPQIDAIVCATYNFGPGFLQGNRCGGVAKLILANPNDPNIISTWSHGSDQQGLKYPGLIKRRNFEAQWYKSGMQS